MGTICIKDMRFYAHHGCFSEEQTIGTHFVVDLRFRTDTSLAEQTDDIAHTVNYLEVYRTIQEEMQYPSHLLEHVAARIAAAVRRRFPAVQGVDVRVSKLNPPLGGPVGAVSVELSL